MNQLYIVQSETGLNIFFILFTNSSQIYFTTQTFNDKMYICKRTAATISPFFPTKLTLTIQMQLLDPFCHP